MIEKIFGEFLAQPEVEAIALGGSRAGENFDDKSDYDVYVYCTKPVSEGKRRKILSKYCSIMEIGNHFWEYEDNCTLNNGTDIDILYRSLDEFLVGISEVVDEGKAHNSYTTCMWHNLITCEVVYDKNGRLKNAQIKYSIDYPQKLKRNIIDRNMKLLRNSLPAYEGQIKKAVKRSDLVSINHRVTEFMASYFDIIFAVNEMTHPGEKRLVQICKQKCKILPNNFEQNIIALFNDMFSAPDKVSKDLDMIISELEKVFV